LLLLVVALLSSAYVLAHCRREYNRKVREVVEGSWAGEAEKKDKDEDDEDS